MPLYYGASWREMLATLPPAEQDELITVIGRAAAAGVAEAEDAAG
jgi:hypothetical protein